MKKRYLILAFSLFFFLIFFPKTFAASTYPECDYYYNKKESNRNQRLNSSYNDPNRQTYYDNYKSNSNLYADCTTQQYQIKQQQAKDFSNLFQKWSDSYKDWDYISAANYYEQALQIKSDDANAKYNVLLCYWQLWNWYFDKKNFNNAIGYYEKYLGYKPNDYDALHNIWLAYINMENYDNALDYFERALAVTFNKTQIDQINVKISWLKWLKSDAEAKAASKTNDTWSFKQYYLDQLNIFEAQKKITWFKNVVIAVIDDWVNINHPDLSKNIRVNQSEIPWNKKDDDKNWYVDDYNGWNFVYNSNNVLPLGVHWTMVAWIIWAKINNREWIAWIMPNVKIMPIGVLDSDWETTSDLVIKGIKYAINNWANIINLSLWGSQFAYNDVYDDIIKKAYEKWIIVVVAAGNWDVLSYQTEWVDTNVNKLSPVCNEWNNKKMIIWVWAFDQSWYRANWSNYGTLWKGCVDVYTPWVSILSTSIMDTTSDFWINYNMADWTSFAAPMIAWIVWLWYSQFWYKLTPDRAYDWLINSLVKNSVGNFSVDAATFIDFVGNQIKEEEKTPTQRCEENFWKNIFSDGGLTYNWWYNCYCKKWYVRSWNAKSCTYIDINKELQDAVAWMYKMWLTTYWTVDTFMWEDYLTREQASKFFVQFTKQILDKTIDITKTVNLSDIKQADSTLQAYIKEANQFWLFKWVNWKFLPFNKLTRAQAIAVIIRAMDWTQDENNWKWYNVYYNTANNYSMLDWLWFDLENLDSTNIKRGEVALFLFRSLLNTTASNATGENSSK